MAERAKEILYGEYSRFHPRNQGCRSADGMDTAFASYILSADDVSWFAAVAGEIRNDDNWKQIFTDRMLVISHLLRVKEQVEGGEVIRLLDSDLSLLATISKKLLADAPDPSKMMTWRYQAGAQLRRLSRP